MTDINLDGHQLRNKSAGKALPRRSGANVLGSGTQIGHTPIRYSESYSVVADQNLARTHGVYFRQMTINGGVVSVTA